MALIWKDRVKETSTTTGTGTYTLAGAVTGFQSFSAIGDGNTCYYCATDGTDWEVGLGTYTSAGTTLARTSVIASSNSGSAVNWSAGTRYVFTTAPAAWMRKNGPGGMSGMKVAYGSATTITIASGECRDSTDTYDLTLAALVTVSIATAGAALGLDETTLAATATTTGASASVTLTASIYSETPMTNTARTLTGAWSTSGTSMTGSGGNAKAEVTVGDIVRSSSKGASRVTVVTDDNTITLVAALPGGNAAADAFTFYENLTIQPNTAVAADKFAVNTIESNGLTVVMSAAISSGAGSGKVAKIGVEIASRFYYPFVVYGSSGTTGILSSQRTRPYGVTGYTTAWRRLCAVYNNSSGNIREAYWTRTGDVVEAKIYMASGDIPSLVAGGTATSYTARNASAQDVAPPTAFEIYSRLALDKTGTNGSFSTLYVRPTGSSSTGPALLFSDTWITGWSDVRDNMLAWLPCDGGQDMDYYRDSTNCSVYIAFAGWKERI